MKHFILALLLLLPLTASAQFTAHVRRTVKGGGRVEVVQDTAITRAVDGLPPLAPKVELPAKSQAGATSPAGQSPAQRGAAAGGGLAEPLPSVETTEPAQPVYRPGGRHKARGFRIQVFTGNNSREDKAKAEKMKRDFQTAFPELSFYITFRSPRRFCRVGDFRTRQEAARYVTLIRRRRLSVEAHVVPSEVSLPNL